MLQFKVRGADGFVRLLRLNISLLCSLLPLCSFCGRQGSLHTPASQIRLAGTRKPAHNLFCSGTGLLGKHCRVGAHIGNVSCFIESLSNSHCVLRLDSHRRADLLLKSARNQRRWRRLCPGSLRDLTHSGPLVLVQIL
jgi:hypothetical protein